MYDRAEVVCVTEHPCHDRFRDLVHATQKEYLDYHQMSL